MKPIIPSRKTVLRAVAILPEALEARRLLSHTALGLLKPRVEAFIGKTLPHVSAATRAARATKQAKAAKNKTGKAALAAPAVATGPFTPTQLRHFYGVDSISVNGVTGTGAGQTIVLIDYNNQPDIKSDLATFDSQFGLPAPPSFIVESQTGSTTALPTSYDSGDAIEMSLDVEYAHAFAPLANLVLIETSFSAFSDPSFMDQYVEDGVAEANATPGASVVSMSYGVSEFPGETALDSYFTTPGITYVSSAGDGGSAGTVYPSISPNVVSVGGTEITASDSNASYGSETVWNDSSTGDGATGGDISTYEAKPTYQSGVTQSSTNRTTPDVSLDASPETGVYVYDSSQQGGGGFYDIGGTSLAAPAWAGMIAVTDQERVAAGLTPLSGSTQTLPDLYALPSNAFHDITTGNNNYQGTGGYDAGPGYDLASGLGTPVAPTLVSDLVGVVGGAITGTVFQDNNANGTLDGTDTGLGGVIVYIDANNNGKFDHGEVSTFTGSNGTFTLPFTPGTTTGTIRVENAPSGTVAVLSPTVITTATKSPVKANFAYFPDSYTSAATTAYTLSLDPTGATDEVFVNGTLTYSAPKTLAPSFTFDAVGSASSLVVDGTNGNPAPAGGVSLVGASTGDTLTVNGTATADDSFVVDSSSLTFDGNPISFINASTLLLDPGAGTDSLAVDSGTVTIASVSGQGIVQRLFSNITLAAGTSLLFATPASHSDRALAITGSLTVGTGSTLNLGGNDLVVQGGNISALTALLATGFAGGAWTGTGINSSAAAADSTQRTALGILANTQSVFNATNPFDGYAASTTDVLIKYTYYGDANLDGIVDGSDFSKIDGAYHTNTLTGWANGDFNYDGVLDGSDYSVIDNVFTTQGSGL